MISDLTTELEKRQAVRDQKKLILNSLIGNCYQYKDHNDKYFTYLRIISVDCDYVEGYKYSKELYNSPIEKCPYIELGEIENMTKITLDEFIYNVSQYLKLHDLQFIPGKLGT